MTARQRIVEPAREVYRGLVRCGRYRTSRDGRGFDAFTTDETLLGRFSSEDAAARAILNASADDGGEA